MKKQQLRTMQTKQKLMDAFWKLYCEKKIDKITVKDITTEAGFYRSTFYEYFADVYAVLDEIEKILLDDYAILIGQITTVRELSDAQVLAFNFYAKHGEYIAVLLGPKGDQKFYISIKEIVTNALKEYFNYDMVGSKSEIIFEIVASSVISMLNYWYKNRETMTIQEVLATGAEFLFSGIGPLAKDIFEKHKRIND